MGQTTKSMQEMMEEILDVVLHDLKSYLLFHFLVIFVCSLVNFTKNLYNFVILWCIYHNIFLVDL
jgi:hypothetical protein